MDKQMILNWVAIIILSVVGIFVVYTMYVDHVRTDDMYNYLSSITKSQQQSTTPPAK